MLFHFPVCSKPFPSSAPGEATKPPATGEDKIDELIGNDVNSPESKDPSTPKEGQNNSPEGDAKGGNNQASPDPNKAGNINTPPEPEEDDKKGKDKLPTLAPQKIDDQQSHNEAGNDSEDAPKDGEAKEQATTAEQNKDEQKDSKPDEDGQKPKEDGTGQEEHTGVGEPSNEKGDKKPATADQTEGNNNPESSEEGEDERDGQSEEKTPIPAILTGEDDLGNEEGENTVDEPSNEQDIFNSKTEKKDSNTKTYQPEETAENSHFFAYLVCAVILVAVLYIASHNKRKVSGSVCACTFFHPRDFFTAVF